MQIERLGNIQIDLEGTASHLEALSKMLQAHATYLRRSRLQASAADIDSIEMRLTSLAASVVDLRGVAENIAKVA